MLLAFETTYRDFRRVDDVRVPFLERRWANEKTAGDTVVEKVSFPKGFPEEIFRP